MIQQAIDRAITDLEVAYNKFQNATEKEEIDVAIVELNVAEERLSQLIRIKKEEKR